MNAKKAKDTPNGARSRRKQEQNAWCFGCRVPMRRHGDYYGCECCNVHVQIAPKRPTKDTGTTPFCLACHFPLCLIKTGTFWRCNRCHYTLARVRSIRRKRPLPTTKRDRSQNPWCLKCRQVMERHGVTGCKSYYCVKCQWATRQVSAVKKSSRTFAEFSHANTRTFHQHEWLRSQYPWCIRCKTRMCRRKKEAGLAFWCRNCGTSTVAISSQWPKIERDAAILEMLNEGYLPIDIIRKLKVHNRTVAKLQPNATPARCKCGRIKHHRAGCSKANAWRKLVEQQKSEFDQLIARINHSLPFNLPPEMRDDIKAQMWLDIFQYVAKIVSNPLKLVKAYNRQYPYGRHISLDDPNNKLAEVLEG